MTRSRPSSLLVKASAIVHKTCASAWRLMRMSGGNHTRCVKSISTGSLRTTGWTLATVAIGVPGSANDTDICNQISFPFLVKPPLALFKFHFTWSTYEEMAASGS